MTEEAASGTPVTGIPSVDGVIDAVSTLAERPIDEHVAVYESAHAALRGALDGTPEAS